MTERDAKRQGSIRAKTAPRASRAARRRIVALSDGRAGNETQALALAEALARARPATIRVLKLETSGWAPKWAGALPAPVIHALGLAGLNLSAATPSGDLQGDLMIGAGRRAAPVVAALARRTGMAAIQLMAPRIAASAFTLVVAPEHDRLTGPNVLHSIGALNRITPQALRRAGKTWRLPADGEGPRRPALAVLVGGPGKAARFTAGDRDRLIALLERLEAGHRLLITPSRRTPDDLALRLRDRFAARNFVWDGSGANPYPGILHWCDAALVTADSVNMVSEAASTGLPVHVFPVTGLAMKLKRFHEGLTARGAIRPAAPPLAVWRYPPLREADRIAAEVVVRLGW